MTVFLLNSPLNTTLFLQNSCYIYQYKTKFLFLNAIYLSIYTKIISIQPIKRTFMTTFDRKLLINSLRTRPEMPLSYHLKTLSIAAKLQGGK